MREADAGLPVKGQSRRHGFSEPSHHARKAKSGGTKVSDAQRPKALQAASTKLKQLLAESMLEIDAVRDARKGR